MANDVKNHIYIKGEPELLEKVIVPLFDGDDDRGFFQRIAPTPKDLDERNGALDEWKMANWGPRSSSTYELQGLWAADDMGAAYIFFETRWSPAVPLMEHLSRMLPGAHVYIEYASEDSGCTGFALFRDGERLQEKGGLATMNLAIWAAGCESTARRAETVMGSPSEEVLADVVLQEFRSTVDCAARQLLARMKETGLEVDGAGRPSTTSSKAAGGSEPEDSLNLREAYGERSGPLPFFHASTALWIQSRTGRGLCKPDVRFDRRITGGRGMAAIDNTTLLLEPGGTMVDRLEPLPGLGIDAYKGRLIISEEGAEVCIGMDDPLDSLERLPSYRGGHDIVLEDDTEDAGFIHWKMGAIVKALRRSGLVKGHGRKLRKVLGNALAGCEREEDGVLRILRFEAGGKGCTVYLIPDSPHFGGATYAYVLGPDEGISLVVSGYGHYRNPALHWIDRGLSERAERQIASVTYREMVRPGALLRLIAPLAYDGHAYERCGSGMQVGLGGDEEMMMDADFDRLYQAVKKAGCT